MRWQLECHVTPFRRSLPLRHLAEAKTNITLISLIRHNSRLHVNRVTRASNRTRQVPLLRQNTRDYRNAIFRAMQLLCSARRMTSSELLCPIHR